jgi:uncharacterized protein (TIGR02246 family)
MSDTAHDSPDHTVDELFDALDRLDLEAIEAFFDEDAQGVDELSGGWRRGRQELHEYFAQITSAGLADVRSTLSDRHMVLVGDVAIVTVVLDQTYTLRGEPQTIHSPTSIVLRRQPARWSVALVHSVPLPDQT